MIAFLADYCCRDVLYTQSFTNVFHEAFVKARSNSSGGTDVFWYFNDCTYYVYNFEVFVGSYISSSPLDYKESLFELGRQGCFNYLSSLLIPFDWESTVNAQCPNNSCEVEFLNPVVEKDIYNVNGLYTLSFTVKKTFYSASCCEA